MGGAWVGRAAAHAEAVGVKDVPGEHRALARRLFELARDEDLGHAGDVTSRASGLTGEGAYAVRAREACVVGGLVWMDDLLDAFGLVGVVRVEPASRDGDHAEAGGEIARVRGPRADVLALERTMLNTLGRLSGVATLTSRYVEAARTGNARVSVCDTRKTTPGLRVLEKHAVRAGGGTAHRLGLHDAVLLKDNHLAGVRPDELGALVRSAIDRARGEGTIGFAEVEVDTLEQLDALLALPAGVVDIVLLDNMNVDRLREAVRRRDASISKPMLEASGGVTLGTIAGIAGTGVERISVGALTHQAVSVDLGLDAA